MAIIGALPYILVNGTVADATQVMADYNKIINDVNANAAPLSGAVLTLATITNSTIDSTTIGAITPSTGRFTTLAATSTLAVTGATTLSSTLGVTGLGTFNAGLKLTSGLLTLSTPASAASASTVDLGAKTSNIIDITGTTTITSFGSTAVVGQEFDIRFTGILVLTYNATSLILPGSVNITTQAGDTARVRALGSSNFQVLFYQKRDGTLLSGSAVSGQVLTANGSGGSSFVYPIVVQQVYAETNDYLQDSNGGMAFTDSIPQNTQGTQFLTKTITPKNLSDFLLVEVTAMVASASAGRPAIALFRDSGADAVDCVWGQTNTATTQSLTIRYKVAAGSGSATTFSVNFGEPNAGGGYLNGNSGGRIGGGAALATMTITELTQ